MPPQFDSYYKWLGIPPSEQPPNHYRLLGVNLFETDSDVIATAADQRMIHLRSFQAGQYANESQQLLNQVSAARICLLRAEKKGEYDAALHQWMMAGQQQQDAQRQAAQAMSVPPPAGPPQHDVVEAADSEPAIERASDPLDYSGAAGDPLDFTSNSSAPRFNVSRAAKTPGVPALMIAGPIVGLIVAIAAIAIFNSQDKDEPDAAALKSAATPKRGDDKRAPSSDSANKAGDPFRHPVVPLTPHRPIGSNNTNGPTGGRDKKDVPPRTGPQPVDNQAASNTTAPSPPNTTPDKGSMPSVGLPSDSGSTPTDESKTGGRPGVAIDNVFIASNENRAPAPNADIQLKLLAKLREILKDDYAKAKSPDSRTELIRKLIQLARETKDDLPMAYVMVKEALDTAVRAGDPRLAAEAVKLMTERYHVDNSEIITKSLVQLSHSAKTSEIRGVIAKFALDLVDPAIAATKYDAAVELATTAATLAAQEKEPVYRDMARDAADRARRAQRASREYETAIEKLAAAPDDPEANFMAGKAECFWKNDWTAGLLRLAKGSDENLRQLAEQELLAANQSPDPMQLADAWWDVAEKRIDKGEKKDDPTIRGIRNRAGHWYRLAEKNLTGLNLAKAQKRIEESGVEPAPIEAATDVFLDDIRERTAKVGHGQLGKHGAKGYDVRGEVLVRGVKPAHALSMHPTDVGAATVNYELSASYKYLTAQVALMDDSAPKSDITFRVLGDGKVLWTSRPMRNKGDMTPCRVSIGGVRSLQLEVASEGSPDYGHAVWLNPKLIR